ncbi:hypothetical protein C0Q70_18318 [Pomacea canaliculata]|uniref:LRAT domain-containing protein n=2 Tax=Pomacea canaliculata TaxID=400727 RepID=A0A2T7NMX1_POMCA|nr:hypothetical protein C0Q70_18318 [Pomacea canaliculata]
MPQKDTDRHNRNLLSTLSEGDLVEFPRGGYSHWGIYAGDEDIIHLVAEEHGVMAFGSRKACVSKDYFFGVAGDSKARKNNYLDHTFSAYKPEVIVERAMSKIGRTDYDHFTNNCEHFVIWCRYGTAISPQAINGAQVTTVLGVIAGVAATAAGIGVTLLKLL